jgi:hypothetical protein
MSAELSGVEAGRSLRIAGSLALIVAASLLAFGGVRLWRFQSLDDRVMTSLSGDYLEAETLQPLIALQAEVAEWTNTVGVRNRARELYLRLGQAMAAPPDRTQLNAANVLAVEPVNSAVWLDLATSSWLLRSPDLAIAAWNMSYVTGPREFDLVHWRVAFMLNLWPELPDNAKRMMFSQLQIVLGDSTRHFGPFWRRLLATLSPETRAQIEREWKAYQGLGAP